MILSASRRTDIPALYADWFCNRLHAGYVYVRNPHAPHQISHICLLYTSKCLHCPRRFLFGCGNAGLHVN